MISGLSSGGTTYYWRVNAANATNGSDWSSVWNFKTIFVMPSAPTLALPSNNAEELWIPLNLSWNSSTNATAYSLQVATNSNFSTTIFSQSGLTMASQAMAGLATATTYYWQVNEINPVGAGPWSSVWSFTTFNIAPSVPVLTSPSNNDSELLTTLNLSWSSIIYATSYSLQVATSSNFSTTIFSQSGITMASQAMTGLATSTAYYWQVNETNPVGTGPWSGVWSFTTISAAPAAPVLISPTNNAVNASYYPKLYLNWSSLTSASSYTVQVSTVADFSTFIQATVSTNTDSISGLSQNSAYYWRVSATNTLGTSAWSNVWKFSDSLIVASVLSPSAKALEFSCFMDGINLNYTMAQPGAVRISFSDILGREKAAINRQQLSGHYTLSLKSLNLSPGVYLIHFRAGNLEKRMRVMLSRR
jgi:hypothetical protein